MSKIDRLKRKISLSQEGVCYLSNAGLFDKDINALVDELNKKSLRYIELSDNNLSDDCIDDLLKLSTRSELVIDSNNFTFKGIRRLISSGNFSKLSFLRNGLTEEQMLSLQSPSAASKSSMQSEEKHSFFKASSSLVKLLCGTSIPDKNNESDTVRSAMSPVVQD